LSAHRVRKELILELKRSVCCFAAGPPGNPEIWWASISEGSAEGGDELGLIGKKFQSGEFDTHCVFVTNLFLCTCVFVRGHSVN